VSAIDIDCATAADGWTCTVTVDGHWRETRHSVTLTRADFQRLASSGESPESLVRRSFGFLLAREPKESILKSFELSDIGRYFPEFEAEITKPPADD
jgi:hypothetical protein